MIHGFRWAWYLFRIALYLVGRMLRLLSRRNVRISAMLAILALGYFRYDDIERLILRQMQAFAPGYQPEKGFLIAGVIIVTFAASFAFALVTALLAAIMSSFRIGRRPLQPARRLKATSTKISPAIVRIVVPPLPRR